MIPSVQARSQDRDMHLLQLHDQDLIPNLSARTLQHSHSENSSMSTSESKLIEALRNWDEAAFASLINRYQSALLRLARVFVSSHVVAEEVVQETWLGVMEGITRFEERSSLKTWLFKILTNRAKTTGRKESRYLGFSQPRSNMDGEGDRRKWQEASPCSDYQAGHSRTFHTNQDELNPERLLLSQEGFVHLEKSIQSLPTNQQQVLILRDIEGLSSKEICHLLHLTPNNQRVLLHRARVRVRSELTPYKHHAH